MSIKKRRRPKNDKRSYQRETHSFASRIDRLVEFRAIAERTDNLISNILQLRLNGCFLDYIEKGRAQLQRIKRTRMM